MLLSQRLSTIIEAAPLAIITYELDGTVTSWNPAAEKVFGWTASEALGKVAPHVGEAHLAGFHALRKRVVQGETPQAVELARQKKDGTPIQISLYTAPTHNSSGKVFGFMGIVEDITERKQAEEALRLESERQKQFIEASPVAIALFDQDMNYLAASQRWLVDYDLQDRDILGVSHYEIFPDIPHRWKEIHQRGMEGETVSAEEDPFERLDGTVQWLRWYVQPWYVGEDTIGGIAILTEDITDRKHAQKAIRDREERFQHLLENLHSGVVVHAADTSIMLHNKMALTLLGVRDDQLIGKDTLDPAWSFVSADGSPMPVSDYPVNQVLASGEPIENFELGINRLATNDRVWVLTNAFPEFDDEHDIKQVVVTFTDISDRKRHDVEVQKRATELALINDIGKRITGVTEVDELLETTAQLIEQNFGYEHVGIFVIDRAQAELTLEAKSGAYSARFAPDHKLKTGQGMVGWVAQTRQKLVANDVRTESRFHNPFGEEVIRAEISVPISVGETVLGVLDIQSRQPDRFKEDDILVLETLADQIGAAIENARLFEAEREQRVLATSLTDTAAILSSTLQLDEVLDRILISVTGLMGSDAANSMLIDEDPTRVRVVGRRGYAGRVPEGLEMPTGYVISEMPNLKKMSDTKEPLIISDTQAWDLWPTAPTNHWVRSYAGAPILSNGHVIGFLNLHSAEPGFFSPEDARRLPIFANQASIAIQNAQLYEDIQRQANELETLREVSLGITSELDLDSLLQTLVNSSMQLIGVQSGGIFLYRPNRDILEWAYSSGPDAEPIGSTLKRGEGLSGRVWETGKPVFVDHYATWEGRASAFKNSIFGASIGVPIQWGDEFIGVLNGAVSGDQRRKFSQREARILSLFADQAATAIQNARLFSESQDRGTYLASLNRASVRISRWDQGLDAALQDVVDTLVNEVGMATARIWLADSTGENLKLGAETGEIPPVGGPVDRIRMKDYRPFPIEEMMQERRPLIFNNLQDRDELDQDWVDQYGLVACAGYPLLVNDRLTAILVVFHREPLSDIMLNVIGSFASHAGAAIENARLYRELELYSELLEDVVEERTAELRRLKERTETILSSIGEAIVVLAPDGSISQVNPAFEKQTGYTSDEVERLGLGTLQKIMGATDQAIDTSMQIMLRGEEWRGEMTFPRKDGTLYDAAVTVAPVRDADGLVTAYVGAFRDISALQEAGRAKDAFVSNVSHELRTPITSMKLIRDLLGRNPERQEIYVERLGRDINRLEDLIEDLLRLSRLEQGQVAIELAPTDLNELIRQFSIDRTPVAESRGLTLTLGDQLDQATVMADKGLLDQAVSALVTNAIHYTPSGGMVTLSTCQRTENGSRWAGFRVSDTGPGIPLDEQKEIFTRFYRGRVGSLSKEPGTGLGLSIVQKITEMHHGMVEVESEGVEGKGALFTVWLPV